MNTTDQLKLRRPEEYSCLTPVLHDVNRAVIAINESSKKVAVDRAMKVVGDIVNKLKADETFCKVYNGIRHVGSYYDGLRVTEPTEFDINIVLKFPFHKICKVQRSTVPGFVQVCVEGTDKSGWTSPFGGTRHSMDWTLKNIVDGSGYIRRDKVLQWWQSMFSRHIPNHRRLVVDGHDYEFKWWTSGPAMTVSIKSADMDLPIDIDLVPVLMFQDGDASSPNPVYQSWIKENGSPKQWYIVPKPLKEDYRDSDRLWRLSFTDQEKVIMNRLDHLKPTNRLMKRLRDNFGWKSLSSYFIKNVFIREAQKKRSSGEEEFFRNNLGYLFVYFLSTVRAHLEKNTLPFFWDPDMNLFIQIRWETALNIRGRVERIFRKIHRLLDEGQSGPLNDYIRSLLIGGHSVCVESNSSSFPSVQSYYSDVPHRVNTHDAQNIFKKDCGRCEKVVQKLPAQVQSCVIL